MKKKSKEVMKFNFTLFISFLWIISLTASGCGGDSTDKNSELRLLKKIKLPFGEPSGITYDETENVFWIVSGREQKVYMIDTVGTILKQLIYTGEDLEGIVLDVSKKTLWIIEEKRRELLQIDLEGNVLRKESYNLSGKKNSGLEGVAQNKEGRLFLLREKNPGEFIELDSNLKIKERFEITFAKDFSDMVFSNNNNLYILSDQSEILYKWSRENGVIQRFELPMEKFEGIAVNAEENRFFIVNDNTDELWIFSLE